MASLFAAVKIAPTVSVHVQCSYIMTLKVSFNDSFIYLVTYTSNRIDVFPKLFSPKNPSFRWKYCESSTGGNPLYNAYYIYRSIHGGPPRNTCTWSSSTATRTTSNSYRSLYRQLCPSVVKY